MSLNLIDNQKIYQVLNFFINCLIHWQHNEEDKKNRSHT